MLLLRSEDPSPAYGNHIRAVVDGRFGEARVRPLISNDASACGKPNWLGILMLVPIAQFVIPFYLAFG